MPLTPEELAKVFTREQMEDALKMLEEKKSKENEFV